jgi:hypothetical protein
MATPELPLPHYNKKHVENNKIRKQVKKAAERLVAAASEGLEVDTMAIKVPAVPATKKGTPAAEAATVHVLPPKTPSVSEGEKPKAVRKPRAKKETQGVVKAEAVAETPSPAPVPESPFSRYVKAT